MSTALDSPACPYLPGQLIAGRYMLEAQLGEGGMGMVWRARHAMLNTPVAIKLVRPELRLTEVGRRLMLEAQVEAQLRHPNIVRVSDFGVTEAGDSFMVMELLHGRSLARELELSGAMPPEQAVRLVLPLIDALSYVHACGIVHRDIKPENILLARSEEGAVLPKIVDFGIATQARSESVEDRITCRGALLGSPPYMPPEQVLSCDVDERADIWSIAVVLHEMISGRPLFDAPSHQAVMRQILERDVPSFGMHGEVAASLWPIVAPALAKDPSERVQSVRAFGIALAAWLLERGFTTDACGTSLALAWSPEAPAPRAIQMDFEAPVAGARVAFALARRDTPMANAPTLRKLKRNDKAWVGAAAALIASIGLTAFTSWREDGPVATALPAIQTAQAQPIETDVTAAHDERVIAQRAIVPVEVEAPGAPAAAAPAPVLVSVREQARADERAAQRRSRASRLGLKDPY